MKAKVLDEREQKTIALILETGDEVMSSLEEYARQNRLAAAHFTAIGAFSDAVLGYFEWDRRQYSRIPVREQVEVLTLAGDITLEGDHPKVHAHVVLGCADASTRGGHLIEAHVRPTLEVIVEESPAHLRRRFNPDAGISLIAP